MKRILLVYPPFCTPASPPYSIAYLYSFLKKNCDLDIDVIDLNLEFHKMKFPSFQKYYQDVKNWKDYDKVTSEYTQATKKTYSENNKKVIRELKPELFDEMLDMINSKKPDIVAFSIVYSSQAFYAYSLIKELKNVKTIIGGPAVNSRLAEAADKVLNNEVELVEYISGNTKLNFDVIPDFSIYDLKEYFTPFPVIPLKTSTTCYYKRCAFCSHFSDVKYYEFPIEMINKAVINSKQKYFFLIDDMIPVKRLLQIAEVMKPLDVHWTCQLRPTSDLDYDTLKVLKESGLSMLMWGIESGNSRILKLINKGTNVSDIEKVLSDSHKAGIKNIVYMLFGFPTETQSEFLDTISFLTRNSSNIDLVSASIFGLQKGTVIYNNPSKFGITKIIEEERTVLEPKIRYEVKSGLTQEEANKLRDNYKRTIEKINKFPKTMNYFREHMFCLIG